MNPIVSQKLAEKRSGSDTPRGQRPGDPYIVVYRGPSRQAPGKAGRVPKRCRLEVHTRQAPGKAGRGPKRLILDVWLKEEEIYFQDLTGLRSRPSDSKREEIDEARRHVVIWPVGSAAALRHGQSPNAGGRSVVQERPDMTTWLKKNSESPWQRAQSPVCHP